MDSKVLRALFKDLEADEYLAVRAIRGRKIVASVYVTTVAEAETFAEKHRNECDVYFGVCTRTEKKPEAKYAKRVAAVWADLDADSPATIEKRRLLKEALRAYVLPPSIIVNSGYQGFHFYYRIAPTEDLEAVMAANAIVEVAVGGDSVNDTARILRVDGTYNHKIDPPEAVRIERCTQSVYKLADFRAVAELDTKTVQKILTGATRGFKSRSERDWHVVSRLVKSGLSDAAIYAIFELHKIGDKVKEKNGVRYFEHTLSKARESIGIDEPTAEAAADALFGGFFEKDDCYWVLSDRHGAVQLSTFTFDPEILLSSEGASATDVLVGTVRAAGYSWFDIPLTRRAFARGDSLIRELPLAAWQWLGSDLEARTLLPYLMEKLRSRGLPKRTATSQLGYHSGFWVGTTQTLSVDGVLRKADRTIAALPTRAERPTVTYSEDDPNKAVLEEFLRLVVSVNRPGVIWPVLGWTAACPYKTRLAELGSRVRFPTLNLFGTRGSGKTSLITQIVQPLMGYDEPRAYDCNTTQFVMLSLLGSTNGVPVAFSEYRRTSLRSPDRILRYLLLLYDSGHDPRGRPDQSVIDYQLDAPISIDGEDAISDPAALERMVQVNMHPEDIAESSEAFAVFQEVPLLDLKAIGSMYVRHTLSQDPDWAQAFKLCKKAFPQPLSDRVRRNLSVILVGLLSLQSFAKACKVKFPAITATFAREILGECLENVINLATGYTPILVDEFVEDVLNEAARDGAPAFVFKYDDELNVLWFHLSTAFGWWLSKRRRQNQPALDLGAIKSQLRERSAGPAGATAGQYVLRRDVKTIEGRPRWCYGISVEVANETGLDVPTRLEHFKPRVVPQRKRRGKAKAV